jgi:hypothetical protein
LDKFQQMEQLFEKRVQTLGFFRRSDITPDMRPGIIFPLFGRRRSHSGGRDIRIVLSDSDLDDVLRSNVDFFTKYEPAQAEYRVWIYRRRHLATYGKVLKYPNKYKGIGRNYDNGWAFEYMREPHQMGIDLASAAVKALDLDFGAVDVLHGTDNVFRVLEVNTAPGVEGPDRQGIRALARRINKWQALGFPERSQR